MSVQEQTTDPVPRKGPGLAPEDTASAGMPTAAVNGNIVSVLTPEPAIVFGNFIDHVQTSDFYIHST